MSMVLGHVGDIGESVTADIPFERVSKTTHPSQRGISISIMEQEMAVPRRGQVMEVAHPNAAGIDIGSASPFCPTKQTKPTVDFRHEFRPTATFVSADGRIGVGLSPSVDSH
jgi:hypothetical protein